jgi:putative spermidine/putrescine transport system ATP-binding protein
MADVVLEGVYKRYGDVVAVRGVDLRVAPGEFVTLLGPSGCGKTTCLRMLAGFVEPDEGKVLIGGSDVTRTPPHRRNAGMVFQSYALFPHKTVAANVAFGMKMRRVPRSEIDVRTAEALRLVKLDQMADRFPNQLSGGQKQRVALARAVVIRPEVLLLDEPLGALDLKLREELQVEIKRVQSALGITTIFVTHDQGEALGMSDRVAVMREGRIVQIDAPHTLYAHPNSEYVANFVGRTNLIEVVVLNRENDGSYAVEAADASRRRFRVAGPRQSFFEAGERCLVGARPEHFEVGEHGENVVRAKVIDVIYRGSTWNVELAGDRNQSFSAVLGAARALPAKGEEVSLTWSPACCFLLKAETPEATNVV